jgi:hypothetical protein
MKIYPEDPNLLKIGQKYCSLYMKIKVGLSSVLSGDIKSDTESRH